MTRGGVRCREGFSLVEVLVALAVSGLIVTAGGGLTSAVQKLESRASAEREARENVISADRLLRAVADGAVPDVSRGREDLEGWSKTSATFVTAGPPVLAFDRPHPVTLAIETEDGRARLLVRWRDPDHGGERQEEVVSGARSLSLSYFGAPTSGARASWQATWPRPGRLPEAVLLRVDMPELGPPIDLIARTYSRLPSACAALPHEPRCTAETSAAEVAE